MTRKNKVATLVTVVNKPDRGDPVYATELTTGFTNVELTLEELADHINKGHPFCPQHERRRTAANFLAADILAVDIDSGWTLEELLADEFVKNKAAMVYVTPSHTPQNPRLRLLVALNSTITEREKMSAGLRGLIRHLGGDESCKDACRMFFGSKGSNPIILGNILSDADLDELIAAGEEQRVSDSDGDPDSKRTRAIVTARSDRHLERNQTVRAANGIDMPLAELHHGATVHCPKHSDRNPSAMVVTNKHGENGVYCSTCGQSFWVTGSSIGKTKQFNFNSLPRLVSELEYLEDDETEYHAGFVGPPQQYPKSWQTAFSFSKQFLPDIPMADGVTFVRSPKGTGKTEWLEKVVEYCRERGLAVLLIGHRQLLLEALAARLGLTCYFYVEAGKHKNNKPGYYYAISLDSMSKLMKPQIHQYDVILLDEAEQVFAHMTASDTLAGKRKYSYMMLAHYIKCAKSVVVCDADLDAITLEAMIQTAPEDMKYRIFLNEYKPDAPDFLYYKDESHLVSEMIEAVRAGGLQFVSTNSIRKAKVLKKVIEANVERPLKIMLITSEETAHEDVRSFITNIKEEFPKYDVVIASPSLGTGIDVTFPNAERLIDNVFGFFVTRVNTHFDIDQQLARVRHPKAIKVFVSPERYSFETDPQVIKSEMLMSRNLNDLLVGVSRDGTFVVDETYMNIYAQVASIQRASKNRLRENLASLRKQNGWRVITIEKDKELAAAGKECMEAAVAAVEAGRIESICGAAPITGEEYNELAFMQATQPLSSADQNSMRWYEITSFYREDISSELVIEDDNRRFRKKIRLAELYLTLDDLVIERERAAPIQDMLTPDVQNRALMKALLRELLTAAGLADDETPIKTDVSVTKTSLAMFARTFRQHSLRIEEHFGISVRGDLEKKAVRTLSDVLDLIGLHTDRQDKKVLGKKIYSYSINKEQLERVQEIVQRRTSILVTAASEIDFGKASKTSWRIESKQADDSKKKARQRAKNEALIGW